MRKVCELESCGSAFEAKREDARFCSAVCRAKASRARRAEGPDPGPTGDRMQELERRIADLEADADADAAERDALRGLSRRIEAQDGAIRRAAQEAVAPIARGLAAVNDTAVTRAEFAEVLEIVDRVELRVREFETAPAPSGQIERALMTLANRTRKLRADLDALLAAINAE